MTGPLPIGRSVDGSKRPSVDQSIPADVKTYKHFSRHQPKV